jgi:hypothetical protein
MVFLIVLNFFKQQTSNILKHFTNVYINLV